MGAARGTGYAHTSEELNRIVEDLFVLVLLPRKYIWERVMKLFYQNKSFSSTKWTIKLYFISMWVWRNLLWDFLHFSRDFGLQHFEFAYSLTLRIVGAHNSLSGLHGSTCHPTLVCVSGARSIKTFYYVETNHKSGNAQKNRIVSKRVSCSATMDHIQYFSCF